MAKRKQLIHVLNANGASYIAMREDRQARMLCDRPLRYQEKTYYGETVSRSEKTIPLNRALGESPALWSMLPGYKPCPACAALVALDPQEREQQLALREQKKQEALAKLQAKAKGKREAALLELDTKIEAARGDALVCLDHLEATGQLLRRCDRWMAPTPPTSEADEIPRCNLPRGHQYGAFPIEKCRARLEGEPLHLDTHEVLAMAIAARKREHGHSDRGTRLYIQRERFRCRDCGWGEHYGRPGASMSCPECKAWGSIRSDQGVGVRDLICRFCDQTLGRDYKLGDYSNEPEVKNHVVVCALRYLGQVSTTDQGDGAILTKRPLPDESFVLSMEDDNESL